MEVDAFEESAVLQEMETPMLIPQELFLFTAFSLFPTFCVGQQMDEAHRIQMNVLGIDGHNDTTQRVLIEGVDIASRLTDGQVDIPRLQEGGMRALSSNVL